MQIFFTFEVGPDILADVLEDLIIFYIWAAWVLFDVYLQLKERFPVWSFTENASFISFYGRIWSY